MKFSIIWFLICFANIANSSSDSAVLNLLERIKSPTFNPFKLTSLIIPKIKEHEIEFEEEAIENAEIHGLSTAEIKSFNLNLTDGLFEIEVLFRNLTLKYDLALKGKIHSDNVDFKGHGHLTLENSIGKIKAKLEIFNQGDDQYLKLLDSTIHWITGQVAGYDLTDQNGKSDEHLMKLLLDHWIEILTEEEYDFDQILHDIFVSEVNAVLSKRPLSKIIG